ncbi:endolytic transglycosylase MltG [Aquimarina sp. ERC-38]|uniref:endolytic transglycosylase MltG n=1 Tax=Aquimarina sp. ERC-38 TaxID=2949996 RepID=UPI0022477114|nr:endolytic transglycosylase MltG [Aquimarina sp. ERC-38]UZO79349.1 endolytic transglycosylase MltG [Aquimarina sp. ERC-38]
MYIKKIILLIAIIGLLAGGWFAYYVYNAVFAPNTNFEEEKVVLFIPTGTDASGLQKIIRPFLNDLPTFFRIAEKKGYLSNIKPGKYEIEKGLNNNEIINTLRSKNKAIRVQFNNQERLEALAGRIANQIEADSIALIQAFKDQNFLADHDFNLNNALAMYIPNSYEFFWNTSAVEFRDRMFKEYQRFWNTNRKEKATTLGLNPNEVSIVASIVQKETAKSDERPRVAGVYLNRLKDKWKLEADPTVIYAIKHTTKKWDTVIKRVLFKDLELDSPYNTYKYMGLPPGLISMPDISSIDAVLNKENHDYYFFVADVQNFGYHKFAKNLRQHNNNRKEYIQWINQQRIRR